MIYTVTPNPGLDRTLTVADIRFDEVLRASASRADPGGKGINVSRALLALGLPSVALGFVGGTTGARLQADIQALGIRTDFTLIRGETRTNTVVMEADSRRLIKVNEAGPMIEPGECEALLTRAAELAQAGDWWVLSGALAPGLPDTFYAQLTDLVQTRGARVALDASGEALRRGAAARPFLVKPNALEAGEFSGIEVRDESSARDAAGFLLQCGVQVVALSLGADGLVLARGGEVVRVRAPRIQVRNTVGAGDALLAGVIYALERDLPLREAARWGAACGSAAAALDGTAFAALGEVQGLLASIP